MLLLATATVVHTAPRAAVAGRSAPLARSSAPRLAVESVSSLEAEFAVALIGDEHQEGAMCLVAVLLLGAGAVAIVLALSSFM